MEKKVYFISEASNQSKRKHLSRTQHPDSQGGKRFYRQKGVEKGSCIGKQANWLLQGYFPYSGWQGSTRQITSSVLMGWFLFKNPFLGELRL